MDTTDFEHVLREACAEAGTDGDNVSQQEFSAWKRFADRRLDAAWRYHYWPDLVKCEQRYYRLPWSATAVYGPATAGVDNSANEVWWALTGQYFIALTTVPVNTPPTDINGNINLAYWGLTAQFDIIPDATGTPYDWPDNPPYPNPVINYSPFDPTVTYVQGNRVQYAGNVYQLYAATVTGDLPTDLTNWGLVVPFDAYVPYEQSGQIPFTVVEECFSANPRTSTRGNVINWFLSERGAQVMTPINYAWVQYRLRCPKLQGSMYRADTGYTPGQTMYFSSANTPGNFYTCLAATQPGNTPETAPTLWAVIAIPRIFHRFLVLGMAADWEKDLSGANSAAMPATLAAQQIAMAELDDVKSLYVGQMGQRVKTLVRTR
jgi:hypothetical protein